MFELRLALKYLLPKRGRLSASLISLLSIAVISLVVWLMLVFLSITEGIEKNWLSKVTALNGHLRINPTEAYFHSYYYHIDRFSAACRFQPRTIEQKRFSQSADLYCAQEDMELPSYLPKPDTDAEGHLKDLVALAYSALEKLRQHTPGLIFQDYELGTALLRLHLRRPHENLEKTLSQVTYVSSFSDQSPQLHSLITQQATGAGPPGTHEILLSKQFRDSGVEVGDLGHLIYATQGARAIVEQQLPVVVAGFYDPGILAAGLRSLFISKECVRLLSQEAIATPFDRSQANGISIWLQDPLHAGKVKEALEAAFASLGIDPYWQVRSYKEYDFAKELLQQFHSDKSLFMIVGLLILLVACCNILSALVLLVNDKKRELGILQAMGVSRKSLLGIFGLCALSIGGISGGLGTLAALCTLRYIDGVAHLLGKLQGHELFQPSLYGNALPHTVSSDALLFTALCTLLLSLLAALVPALKACRLPLSSLLRSE